MLFLNKMEGDNGRSMRHLIEMFEARRRNELEAQEGAVNEIVIEANQEDVDIDGSDIGIAHEIVLIL